MSACPACGGRGIVTVPIDPLPVTIRARAPGPGVHSTIRIVNVPCRVCSAAQPQPGEPTMPDDAAKESVRIFCRAAEMLWGRAYVTPAAQSLGINTRTIQRWNAGDGGAVPDGVLRDLKRLLAEKSRAIAGVSVEINKLVPPTTDGAEP